MIIKITVFLVVLFLVYIVFFKKSREANIKDDKYKNISDTMVECPSCNVFVSKNEAILSNGQYYCSKECLK
ncbi:MAG: hypothetical protein HOF69_02015 [Campylobacteraceae bacterium]|jgi:uncharacterized protein|nr:hypothetical protein [Campylobacteraceae bacterium]MBT3882020.1 hypothetical protein [Campylobacteraceae bacterium]MBT4029978.1 hypothetical protein [Campylobacteraceae bacterium]MBT4179938.1 hypothetical protein [Campylobacteraceae bacterium]MBT4572242.1 hypothetical protein [Campylobacteraceae bacterium]